MSYGHITNAVDKDRTPDAWIIESKAGIWLTQKPEVAEKNRAKPGVLVVPYYSKKGETNA